MNPPESRDGELHDLDRRLAAIRFTPRASLGPELAGRAKTLPTPVTRRLGWLRYALGVSAVALVMAGAATLGRRAWFGESHTVDRCCSDLDGGGAADDGLVVEASGNQIRHLVVYEDRDHSGGYSRADTLRFTRDGPPVVTGAMNGSFRTTALCCLDFDGGGLADDGVLVIGRPPDRIAMAALYERRGGRPDRYPLR